MQQVSITAPDKIYNNTKSEKTTTEKIKEKWEEIPDGNKKIAAALTGLAALAAAGVAIYRGKASKAQEEIKEAGEEIIQQAAQKVDDIVQDAAQKADDVIKETAKKAPDAPKNIIEIRQKAKQEIIANPNADYQKIRREALNNSAHNEKKLSKKKLHEAIVERNKKIQQQHSDRVALFEDNDRAAKDVVKANHGIKSATGTDELDARIEAAKQAAQKAQDTASELEQKAETRKDRIRAKAAQKRADEARLEAKKVEINADRRKQELVKAQETKAKNIEESKKSPNYEQGFKKMEENREITSNNSADRLYNRELEKAKKKYRSKNSNHLKALLNKGNISELDKMAITEILNNRT